MDKIHSFTQLRTWQMARELAVNIYRQTETFPRSEQFGLSSQMRRASVSVAANIAEGFSRATARDKCNFYIMALGSLTETASHSYIAQDLGYLSDTDLVLVLAQISDINKMINGLIKSAKGKVIA